MRHLAIGLVMLAASGIAWACPDGQHELCVGPFHTICGCVPDAVPSPPTPPVNPCLVDPASCIGAGAAGLALEGAFNASRATAYTGSMPVPEDVRLRLRGLTSEDDLNTARYQIQDNGALNLAHLIFQVRAQDIIAVTLVDVIVFRGPTEAADICNWAHELKHVNQFRSWGTGEFARSYTNDWHNVENPAYAVTDQCKAAIAQYPTRYNKHAGYFKRIGNVWLEYPSDDAPANFRFIDGGSDGLYYYLIDRSRTQPGASANAFIVRLPKKGGVLSWSYQNRPGWIDNVLVEPALAQ